jgi:hypothetical protein
MPGNNNFQSIKIKMDLLVIPKLLIKGTKVAFSDYESWTIVFLPQNEERFAFSV